MTILTFTPAEVLDALRAQYPDMGIPTDAVITPCRSWSRSKGDPMPRGQKPDKKPQSKVRVGSDQDAREVIAVLDVEVAWDSAEQEVPQ